MIEVQNLVKQYGDHRAVDDLSFTVKKGQIYGFLGPNGAGKSTTMNIMTGYIGMTSGKVVINGHDIMEEPELARKSIGYLPELPPLYTEMTAREYLTFAAELKSIPKARIKESVDEVIKRTSLTERQNRLIKNLSKGYRQRVGLAQAILGYPEIIILDEPTVGLDPKQIIEIRDLIKSLAGKHTILLSSHILSEIEEICDQILIIHHGKLIADGSPEELERKMRSSKIDLTVRSDDPEAVRAVLSCIVGIKSVMLDKPKNGEMPVKIIPEKDVDIREAIFNAFADASMPLLMLRPEIVNLESIFIELTSDKTLRKVKKKRVAAPSAEASAAAISAADEASVESPEDADETVTDASENADEGSKEV